MNELQDLKKQRDEINKKIKEIELADRYSKLNRQKEKFEGKYFRKFHEWEVSHIFIKEVKYDNTASGVEIIFEEDEFNFQDNAYIDLTGDIEEYTKEEFEKIIETAFNNVRKALQ